MSLVGIIIILLAIGFIIYMIQSAPIPIHPWIKTLIIGLISFAVIIWVLNVLGFHTGLHLTL